MQLFAIQRQRFVVLAGRAFKISQSYSGRRRFRIKSESARVFAFGVVQPQSDVTRRAQRLMGSGRIGRQLDRQFRQATGFVGVFNGQEEFAHRQHPLGNEFGQRFSLMRRLDGCGALATQKKVHRNARDHFCEQTVRHVRRCRRNGQPELLQAAINIAGL